MGPHKKSKKRDSSPDDNTDDETSTKKRKHEHSSKKKKKMKKRKHKSSSSDSPSASSSEEERRRLKKKQKRAKKKSKKQEETEVSTDIPLDLMGASKTMAPMTKEEWEKKQNVVRRVYDETTGRHRLIKGDGEVIEEIVSRDRHRAINQQATSGDGDFFQAQMVRNLKK